MSGYTNFDGSNLVGGQKAGGQGQALQLDAAGNLLVNVAAGGGGGSVVNIADPNTPANKLAVDATGKIGLNNFPAEQAVNLNQVNGAAHSVGNPVITEDQIRAWIANGQSFSATTGKQSAAGAINAGFSVFNPAGSGRTLIVYASKLTVGNTAFNVLTLTTSDPVYGTTLTVTNNRAGSSTASVTSATFTNSNVTTVGTANDIIGASANTSAQFFYNGDVLVIPPGNGFAIFVNVSGANNWCVSAEWIEE